MVRSNTGTFKIGKAYRIKWTDNCGTPAGWISLEEKGYSAKIPKVVSYGVLINKSKEAVVLAQSYVKGNDSIQKQAMGIVVISIACITEAVEI